MVASIVFVCTNSTVVGAAIGRPLLAGGAIRYYASTNLYFRCPTRDTGSSPFCTRVLN